MQEIELTDPDRIALAELDEGDETRTEYAVLYPVRGQMVASGPYPHRRVAEGVAKARRGLLVERTVYVTYRPWTVVNASTPPA